MFCVLQFPIPVSTSHFYKEGSKPELLQQLWNPFPFYDCINSHLSDFTHFERSGICLVCFTHITRSSLLRILFQWNHKNMHQLFPSSYIHFFLFYPIFFNCPCPKQLVTLLSRNKYPDLVSGPLACSEKVRACPWDLLWHKPRQRHSSDCGNPLSQIWVLLECQQCLFVKKGSQLFQPHYQMKTEALGWLDSASYLHETVNSAARVTTKGQGKENTW